MFRYVSNALCFFIDTSESLAREYRMELVAESVGHCPTRHTAVGFVDISNTASSLHCKISLKKCPSSVQVQLHIVCSSVSAGLSNSAKSYPRIMFIATINPFLALPMASHEGLLVLQLVSSAKDII
jgi:hypothetical protein